MRHPTGKTIININTLTAMMDRLGRPRVEAVATMFTPLPGPDSFLFDYPNLPTVTLSQVTAQVTMRLESEPIRHLPLSMDCAKRWAACLVVKYADVHNRPLPAPTTLPDPLMEALADAEHEGWSHWQRYLHSQCIQNPDGSLTIPAPLVERWTRQMHTPYADLSEREKDSDRDQVRRIVPLITPYLR